MGSKAPGVVGKLFEVVSVFPTTVALLASHVLWQRQKRKSIYCGRPGKCCRLGRFRPGLELGHEGVAKEEPLL